MIEIAHDELEKICNSIDEEERLMKALYECPAYDYLTAIGDFSEHIDYGLRKMTEIVAHLNRSPDDLPALRELAFFLFSIGSVHLSLESLLYAGAKSLMAETAINPIIDRWKHSVPPQIVKAYRNRLQHGRYALPFLSFQERTQFHSDGPGCSIFVSLTEVEFKKVVAEVPGGDGIRERCSQYLETEVKGRPAGILALVTEYRRALSDVVNGIRLALDESQPAEFNKMNSLFAKIDAERSIQRTCGAHDPREKLIRETEKNARSWISASAEVSG